MVGSAKLRDESHVPDSGLPTVLTLGRLGSSDGQLDDQHQLVTLLAFLAHNGPTDRRTVATMFWPHAPKPLNSLSSALSRIRKLIPGAVDADRHQVTGNCRTDAQLLVDQLEDPEAEPVAEPHGIFLAGFSIPKIGIELEEWVFDTRDAVAGELAQTAIQRCQIAVDNGDDAVARRMASYAVSFDLELVAVLDSAAILYRVLRGAGDAQAVPLAQVATSNGIDIEANPAAAITTDQSRRRELHVLREEVAVGRVVNLFGLGGVGKSWLVRQFVQNLSASSAFDKVIVVEVATVANAAELATEVAAAFDRHGLGPVDPVPNLAGPTLLVLDSVDAAAPVLDSVVALNGHDLLGVLVVSRLRLDDPSIKGVALRGLAIGAETGPGPAVQLFVRAAERARPDLVHDEALTAASVEICRQLAGVPLAIELTAAWLGVVPPADVLSVLDDDEILEEPPPGEDLSLARVIEQSWELLPFEAQRGLSGLSVLGASFSRQAARAVADVGMRGLAELRDHSLVDVEADGRIRCHSLIQAYARRRLDADIERRDELLERHRSFFVDAAIAAIDSGNGHVRSSSMAELVADRENIELAWRSMVDLGRWEPVQASLPAIDSLLLRSGHTHRALDLYRHALAALDRSAGHHHLSGWDHEHLLAAVASNLAWVEMLLGNTDGADDLVDLGLEHVGDNVVTEVALRRTRCALRANEGDSALALAGYQQAQTLVSKRDHPELAALLDEDIGRSLASLGKYDDAIEAFRRTLDASRRFGDLHMEARSYLMIGVAQTPSDPDHALVLFSEGERLAVEHGLGHLAAYFPVDRAKALVANGDDAGALAELERGVGLADNAGDQVLRVSAELSRGRVLLRARRPAARVLIDAVRLGIRTKLWAPVLGAALEVSEFVIAASTDSIRAEIVGEARRIQTFALEHPHTEFADRDRFGHDDVVALGSGDDGRLSPTLRLDEFGERLIGLVGRI